MDPQTGREDWPQTLRCTCGAVVYELVRTGAGQVYIARITGGDVRHEIHRMSYSLVEGLWLRLLCGAAM
ncbi:hypothetical protein ABGB17_13180 [Sphaerisporangium sp. B11E5]|uniref:hypothetical protein n=1 Tax=Sphaerisporangium sp. B11E5 TaxID=3153563 RepID=UPI00325F5867